MPVVAGIDMLYHRPGCTLHNRDHWHVRRQVTATVAVRTEYKCHHCRVLGYHEGCYRICLGRGDQSSQVDFRGAATVAVDFRRL